jgi:acyl dehydratase
MIMLALLIRRTENSMARSIEDFAVGQRHVSASFLFTEQEIVDFARKYDPQYFHLDPERAAKSHFGGLVAAVTRS